MKRFYVVLVLALSLAVQPSSAARYVPKSDLINQVLQIVQTNYVDPERVDATEMLKTALQNLASQLEPVLVIIDDQLDQLKIKVVVDKAEKSFVWDKLRDLDDLNETLQEIVLFVKQQVELKDVDNVDYAVINGFLLTLDPHSRLLLPKIFADFKANSQGSFFGVGMVIGIRDNQLTVISPMPGTPAFRAGLQAQDKILQINQESTINMSLDEAVTRLRGPRGTEVDIKVSRSNLNENKTYVLTRDEITISSVDSAVLSQGKKRLGYLHIKSFQQNTTEEINEALAEMNYSLKDFHGLILDFRNNPGGLLSQAYKVSNRFLSKGVVVSVADAEDSNQTYRARPYFTLSKIPIIMLGNHGSASASEIVVAALKKNNRAVFIGQNTFGKGSVQNLFEQKDGSALKLTTSKYLTVGGVSIQSIGVMPHLDIEPYSISKESVRVLDVVTDSESTLKNAFIEWGDEQEQSDYSYFYFQPEITAAEQRDHMLDVQKMIEKDYTVNLAKDILFNYPNATPEKLLESTLQVAKIEQAKQEKVLIDQFAKLDIDWNSVAENSEPELLIKSWFEVKRGGTWYKSGSSIKAGQEIRWYVDVQNNSLEPISRLVALSKADNPRFDNRQFVFGTLQPGAKKQWYLPFKLSLGSIARQDLVMLEFEDGQRNQIDQFAWETKIEQNPSPYYSYQVSWLADKNNKNDTIQIGERIFLSVQLKNLSKQPAGELSILLKNDSGDAVFLHRGTAMIKSLAAGEQKQVEFELEFKHPPADNLVELDLNIIDQEYFASSVQDHQISLPFLERQASFSNHTPVISVEQPNLVAKTPSYVIEGEVSDDQAVKDLVVFVNDQKIFYQSYQQQAKIKFKIDLELTKDMNRIILASRDNRETRSTKTLFVRKISE